MSTSGTFDFTVTRDDLVREAMLNIGRLGQTETPTPQETTDISRKLNMMVKQWQGRQDFAPGLKMWTRQRADLFLSQTVYQYVLGTTPESAGYGFNPNAANWAAGCAALGTNFGQDTLSQTAATGATQLYVNAIGNYTVNDWVVIQLDSGDIYTAQVLTVGSGYIQIYGGSLPSQASSNNYLWNYTTRGQRPLEIVTCVLRDVNYNDTPLNKMTLETYEILPNKTSPQYLSDPQAFYYEAQLNNGQLYLDVGGAQDVTKHLHVVYLQEIMDFNNPLDNPEYPQEWYMALAWGLTKQIAPMFNVPFTPDMDKNYMEALAMARQSNAETTEFYFQVNSANPYSP